jgi:hypothetical protein
MKGAKESGAKGFLVGLGKGVGGVYVVQPQTLSLLSIPFSLSSLSFRPLGI